MDLERTARQIKALFDTPFLPGEERRLQRRLVVYLAGLRDEILAEAYSAASSAYSHSDALHAINELKTRGGP